jgi:ribonuclease BN (tRNA processing enzyme)
MRNKLTIFGSAAGYPTKRRPHTTAVGLWRGDGLYLFDAGAGIADQFAAFDVDPEATRAIFLTHTHADHVGGLAPLLQSIQLKKRTLPLPLYIPNRAWEGIRDYLHFLYLRPLKDFDLQLHPITAGFTYEETDLAITAVRSHHLEPSEEGRRELGARTESQAFSYVITADDTRVYLSGDIHSPDEAAKHGAKADLAVVEIAHFEPEALAEALADSGISRLVVSHVPAALEPHEAELPDRINAAGFEGEVIVATDGLRLEL